MVTEAASQGSTQTVAVIDAYDDPTAESDLAAYRSEYGLSPCTTANGCFRKVDQNGGANYPAAPAGSNWATEIALDLDAVSAICPNCHILLVEADDPAYGNLALAADLAATLGATQISNSYLGGEWVGDRLLDQYYTHAGVAVTAVGGTSLTVAPSSARAWIETARSGAGSGCSAYEPKPASQTDTGCAMRTVADVAADADPASGAAVYSTVDGGWVVLGGTSLASPLVAAYDALVMSSQGSAAASPSFPHTHPGSYYHIASGSTGSCVPGYLCNAGSGFDGPTGVGSPHGAELRPPALLTGTASAVTGTSATLSGQVSPRGADTHYHFDYGTSTAYGASTASVDAGSGSSLLSGSASLTRLTGNTTYHFRIVATNAYGTRYGLDNVLSTGPSQPRPTNTVAPLVSGGSVVGHTLAVAPGSWTGSPDSFGYQWWHCMPVSGGCVPSKVGTNSTTYLLTSADIGGQVYARPSRRTTRAAVRPGP